MIEKGKNVIVHYVGKFETGEIFDSSEGLDPLEFEIGSGQIIKGFEDALIGKNIGDSVTITINPEDAYGLVQDDLVVKVTKDKVPDNVEVGTILQANHEGNIAEVIVLDVADDYVLLDANHPMAGKVLIFDIDVVSVE